MRECSNHKFILLLLATLFILCSCDQNIECIDPDNWGGRLYTTIGAGGPAKITKIGGLSEVIAWTPSYVLDGSEVIMVVKNNSYKKKASDLNKVKAFRQCENIDMYDNYNTWTPILGNVLTNTLPLCTFATTTCSGTGPDETCPWCELTDQPMMAHEVPTSNSPCRLNQGLGLYLTLSTEGAPNARDFKCNADDSNPTNCFMHIGDAKAIFDKQNDDFKGQQIAHPSKVPTTVRLYDNLCPAVSVSFMPPVACQDPAKPCTMYFKIMDRFYTDNVGEYTIEFRKGVRILGGGLVTKFVGLVQGLLCSTTQRIFTAMTTEPASTLAGYLRVLLLLYIIFLGFSSLMGFTQLSHKELLVRTLKIGLIGQLTAPHSWNFFNTYFFQLFTNGIGEITGMIFHSTAVNVKSVSTGITETCQYQQLEGFAQLDILLAELFSYETTRKFFALLFWKGYGFLYIIAIFICLAIVLFILMRCILIYLVSFLVISILITLAPIFIPFILFDFTHNLFDNWLKALTSYFIQPIIILTFAFFVLQIFMTQMHSLLGYRVCWKELVEILNIPFFAWQHDFDKTKVCMPTPNPIFFYDSDETANHDALLKTPEGRLNLVGSLNMASGSNPNIDLCGTTNELCSAYTCAQKRYIGFPYVDPNFTPDAKRLKNLLKFDPIIVSLEDIILLVMIIWFMYQFSKAVPGIAKQLAGGGGAGKVNLGAAAAGIQAGIPAAFKTMSSGAYSAGTGGRHLGDDLKKAGGAIARAPIAATVGALGGVGGFLVGGAVGGARAITGGKGVLDTIKGVAAGAGSGAAKGAVTGTKGTFSVLGKMPTAFKGAKEKWQDYAPAKFDKIADSKPFKITKVIAQGLVAPHKLVAELAGKTLEKVGVAPRGAKDWMGKKKEKAGKWLGDKAKRQAAKADEFFLGNKHPELISDKAQSALDKADAAMGQGKYDEAVNLYGEAADEGSTNAMTTLAHMHEYGAGTGETGEEGVEQDLSKARELYDRALRKGDMSAQGSFDKLEKQLKKATKK